MFKSRAVVGSHAAGPGDGCPRASFTGRAADHAGRAPRPGESERAVGINRSLAWLWSDGAPGWPERL